MKKPMWVYVAGPYTNGDTIENVRDAILVGIRLRQRGFVPVIPHLFMAAHLVEPHSYTFWMGWDAALLERCDALVRLHGESSGSDEEADVMEQAGKLVFLFGDSDLFGNVDAFCAFVNERQKSEDTHEP